MMRGGKKAAIYSTVNEFFVHYHGLASSNGGRQFPKISSFLNNFVIVVVAVVRLLFVDY